MKKEGLMHDRMLEGEIYLEDFLKTSWVALGSMVAGRANVKCCLAQSRENGWTADCLFTQ